MITRMKKNLLILILLALSSRCFTQNILDSIHPLLREDKNWKDITKVFEHYEGPTRSNTTIILGLFHSNKLFHSNGLFPPTVPDEIRRFVYEVRKDTNYYRTPDSKLASEGVAALFDSTGIIVTASGVNHNNAHEFEFRVLQNRRKEIISWSSIKLFRRPFTFHNNPDGSEQTENAYLGEFKTNFGNSLTIELRRKSDTINFYSISAIWINKFPKIIATFSDNEMPQFLTVFKQQWKNDFTHGVSTYYGDNRNLNIDSLLVLRNNFKPDENSLIFYLADKVRTKDIIEYNLVKNGHNSGWKPNDFDFNILWLKDLQPGNYKLQIRYSVQRPNILEYKFIIQPAWYQTILFKILVGVVCLVLLGFVFLLFRSGEQKRKLEKERLQKMQVQTELKSIHSQFNPHFVFNALGSIQALITKNDLEGANVYLSEFSTLLRDSLKNSGKEMVSLVLEIKMLDSYLKLEQLRFGFNYTIDVDEDIDQNAMEIPALLLQPLIENAVKHGIAPLYDKGTLAINFKKRLSDMFVIISDNGPGYDTNKTSGGFGLKLTRERIELLNRMLKE
jgi:hypothetical protein